MEELLRVAQIIEKAIDQYIRALQSISTLGRWEAPIEGWSLSWLLIRNIEAVVDMARHDEVLVTAAWSNVRVVFEQSVRIQWMLEPDDRYEAECRWLALLAEYEKFEGDMAKEAPADGNLHSEREKSIRGFRLGVIDKLPDNYRPAKKPNLRDMLNAINNSDLYRFYREGSQYVHGGMYGSGSYRHNLGNERLTGDFTSTVDWILPMRLCWLSFRNMAIIVLYRLGVTREAAPNWAELTRAANSAFDSLAKAVIANGNKERQRSEP